MIVQYLISFLIRAGKENVYFDVIDENTKEDKVNKKRLRSKN